jgi:2-dehydropantoate 2-reductase
MRYIVYGAGAVGSAVGGLLSYAGKSVNFIGRKPHIDAINKNGLQLNSYEETMIAKPSGVYSIKHIVPQKDDVIFLCVRTNDTKNAVNDIIEFYPKDTPIFAFQNSVVNEKILSKYFSNVYGVAVKMTCYSPESGITNFRSIGRLVLGKYPLGTDAKVKTTANDLISAGFEVSISENIMQDKWLKLAINAVSSVSAIFMNEEISRDDVNRVKVMLLEEIQLVLSAANISSVPCEKKDKDIPALIDSFRLPAELYRPKIPVYNSTWTALNRGTKLENKYYLGIIIELSEKHNLSAHICSKILQMCDYLETHKYSPTFYGPEDIEEVLRLA